MSAFKKGDKVAIINSTLGGRYLVETKKATIIRIIEDGARPYARVRIGMGCVDRFIDTDAQADPEAYVAALNAQVQP